MRKKDLLEVVVKALISLYHEAKTKVRGRLELPEKIVVSWCTLRICAVAAATCNCGGCNQRECKKNPNE